MANPNIVSVTAIYGENSLTSLTSTSATSILSNAASSGKVYKVNSIIVSNVDGTSPADITINVYSAAALGGTAFPIVSTLSVPADASVIVVDKSTGIYIKENQSIGATAGTANDLVVVASWEEIN
jgi:hypothetical protein